MKDQQLRILVVGSGGREHALAWKLSQSSLVDIVHVAPGNGGTEATPGRGIISNVNIAVDDFAGLVSHSKKHRINLAVIGPEAPLVAGIQGFFQAANIRCFGPTKDAAQLEGSKAFSKDFMQRHGIPTAAYRTFSDYDSALRYLNSVHHDIVIKADGLAAGKGVIIPQSRQEAHQALKDIMVDRQFGSAGDEVVIEEFLEGEELSVLTFTDGHTIKSLPPAQDHKRIYDGDQGPNTGGMGCYAPTRVASKKLMAEIDSSIVQPTIDNIRKEGTLFVGVLFTGLMVTKSGPKVLEYNVRGGDPETQTLLPLLSESTDLAKVMWACTGGFLDAVDIQLESRFAVTVVASAEGYPGPYVKNKPLYLNSTPKDTLIFHAGTSLLNKNLLATGGRVIAATSTAATLEEAVARAYEGMKSIQFDGIYYRKDIARRAFNRDREGKENDNRLSYAAAGVSIDAGNSLVSRIKCAVKSTARPGADAVIGSFGGAFSLPQAGYHPDSPTIIAAMDGIGTKLKLAYKMNKHNTVGIDLVAMNVNDLIVQGAEPLCFLDYYACGKLDVETAAAFVEGVAEGCKISNSALIGGETAEMPGIYARNEYDAAGVAIGAIDTKMGKIILPDKESMAEGDVLLGLASSGVHANGFSLIHKILDKQYLSLTDPAPWNPEKSTGDSLLTPTKIYVKSLRDVVRRRLVKGLAHITGGGLVENVPRMLPDHLVAHIDVTSWKRPKVFEWLQDAGKVDVEDISRTFNNGIGMVIAVSEFESGEVRRALEEQGEVVYQIGKLVPREDNKAGCLLQHLDTWGIEK